MRNLEPTRVRSLAPRAVVLAVVAIGLSACGSSATKSDPITVNVLAPASTTSTASAPQTKTTSAPKRGARPAHQRTRKPAVLTTPTKTTIAANTAAPAYTGPSPVGCLQAAGLNRARAAREPQVWEANSGASPEQDSNAIVFLSGPYKNKTVARNYAKSLLVVELASSGGRWVASASVRSHLGTAVRQAAACMARSSSS